MEVLFEDKDIIVVKKEVGIATQTAKCGEKDLVSEIKGYLYDKSAGNGEPYLGVIHRLDQPVEGILAFAKNPSASKNLSEQVREGQMTKEYRAVVCGRVEPGIHTLVDYLKKDAKSNTSIVTSVNEKNAKRAELAYQLCPGERSVQGANSIQEELHLVKIHLYTGRHHQIRVQMAHAGMPLLGDRKYGKPVEGYHGGVNLCACRLALKHPGTMEKLEFTICPTNLQMYSEI